MVVAAACDEVGRTDWCAGLPLASQYVEAECLNETTHQAFQHLVGLGKRREEEDYRRSDDLHRLLVVSKGNLL